MISGNSLDRESIQWILSQTDGRRLRLSRPPPPPLCGASLVCNVRACGFFPPGVLCECFLFPVFAFPCRFFNSWAAYPVREFPIGLNLSVFGRTTVSCSISFGDLGDRGGIQGGEGLQAGIESSTVGVPLTFKELLPGVLEERDCSEIRLVLGDPLLAGQEGDQQPVMLMLRSVSGVATPQQLCCTSCHSTTSPSTSFHNLQYGSSRAGASGTRALQAIKAIRLMKPVALKNLSNNTPFLTGQSLRFTTLKNAGASEKKPSWKLKVEANAIDAGNSQADGYPEESIVPGSDDEVTPAKAAAGQRLKIGTYFVLWWSLNVVFNIYNKKVLNVFPYPWLTSTLSLAAGSSIMLVSWATRLAKSPELDVEFWKALAPVALAHTIGHVAATVSMSKVAVSFTHIIKSAEPAFSVLISRVLLGENFSLPVYLSLIPIIGGCALTAATELNFNITGFVGAMISNIAFVFRNIFSKRGMVKSNKVGGMNYYACLSMLSLVFLTPFAFAVEGPKLWATGWQQASETVGQQFVWWVLAQSVFYHLYNQVSYMSLNEISPLTFSIGNTMKRVTVIVSSIIVFHTPVLPVNAVGAAIAILGTFLYSQAKQ